MTPELGQLALVLAFLLAVAQGTLPLWGAWRGNRALMAVARPAAAGQAVFVTMAFAILAWAFMHFDFSVQYVADNSNLTLPWYYRFAAVWGAHEGSLLLWVLILDVWTVALLFFGTRLPEVFFARVLGVMGLVSVGFLAFLVFTSNPFGRLLPEPPNGADLNPVLQDPGMALHPPVLYMGYVGFSVAFAFSIAALLSGEVEQKWVRWARPWTNAAWGFLTLGIVAGSHWAYHVLGWGGWWFWDPVENASFMPWLAGAALIHAQAITEKRGGLRAWTLLLSIFAFALSLLGTFLVRSGVLTSVHAFASDPRRGVYILIYLVIVVGGSLLLYALRAPKMTASKPFNIVSRETALLIGNLMLISAAAMVMLGTLFPLIGDALHLGRISVGPPYFGLLFPLLMIPVVALMPLGPFLGWGDADRDQITSILIRIGIAAAACALLTAFLTQGTFKAILGVASLTWIGIGVLLYAYKRYRTAPRGRRYPAEMAGMLLAHFGVAVFVAGVLLSESLSVTHDVRLAPGQTKEIAGYSFQFNGVHRVTGPNYRADQGVVTVSRDGSTIAVMHPQKRTYSNEQVQTESAINGGVFRDLYVALGEPMDPKNIEGAWALRLYYKPFVSWIWIGGLFMMCGGFVCAADKRFRIKRIASEVTPAGLVVEPQESAA
ncbi:MAG: heme lyase CcmF/NrfE family subunit [Rhodanobacter sp.]|nr:MAG: heme lyase CcmF/NrfE family subunit [Rhodanobacter sp.]TAM10336.1 MAG: heme lyase CcmF/NrfE family subunit [Rhodanobacter sp.]TAM34434.1 MAG: heme lyase CcmF/NrfE family subunit [Rhodanobacter sp.]